LEVPFGFSIPFIEFVRLKFLATRRTLAVVMSGSDAEVKKAAELKLWLESRITELQEEIERLKEALNYVDTT